MKTNKKTVMPISECGKYYYCNGEKFAMPKKIDCCPVGDCNNPEHDSSDKEVA